MPTELTLVLWFDDDNPLPTNEDIENDYDCAVIDRQEEDA